MKEKNKFNETKFLILSAIHDSDKYLSSKEISELSGVDLHTVRDQLCRLVGVQHVKHSGYIWRYQNPNLTKCKDRYLYRYLKNKGRRVYEKYAEYKELTRVTGIEIPLIWPKHGIEKSNIVKARQLYAKINGTIWKR